MPRAARIRRVMARGGLGAIALLSAGLTGCGAATLALAAFGLIAGLVDGGGGFSLGLGLGFLIGLMTLPFWVGGLFLIGGPLWAVLHHIGRRDRLTAIVAGGVAAGIVTPLVLWGVGTNLRFSIDPDAGPLVLSAGLPAAVGGAVAGFTAWRVGYGEGRVR